MTECDCRWIQTHCFWRHWPCFWRTFLKTFSHRQLLPVSIHSTTSTWLYFIEPCGKETIATYRYPLRKTCWLKKRKVCGEGSTQYSVIAGWCSGVVPTLRQGDQVYRSVSTVLSAAGKPQNLVHEIPGLRDKQVIYIKAQSRFNSNDTLWQYSNHSNWSQNIGSFPLFTSHHSGDVVTFIVCIVPVMFPDNKCMYWALKTIHLQENWRSFKTNNWKLR